jgi:hypothetical protein
LFSLQEIKYIKVFYLLQPKDFEHLKNQCNPFKKLSVLAKSLPPSADEFLAEAGFATLRRSAQRQGLPFSFIKANEPDKGSFGDKICS